MAEVYEATHQGHPCAIKILQRRLQLDRTQTQRFENEGSFLLNVRHENLVDVQDMGVWEGSCWIRMELLVGMDLREAIHRLGAMSVGLVGVWLRQVAFGAHQCHTFGVVHRDIKPENVMLLRPDGVKLLDLGVAKIDGEIVTLEGGPEEGLRGTALYMSREQVNNEKHITPAADVYALGMMGWEMFKGEHPYLLGGQRFELMPTLYKQIHEEVPPLHTFGFDRRLSRVFERALSKDWRKRQPDGLAFAEDLGDAVERYLLDHPHDDPNPGEPVLAWLFGEKKDVPSFGTGPMSGQSVTGIGPRRKGPIPVGPLGSANELPAEARPMPRFQTQPLTQVPPGWFLPPVASPVPSFDERVTDLAPPPLEIRRFDTTSMLPEHRDPSAVRALAEYRPVGKTRGAKPRPEPPRGPRSTPEATVIPILRSAADADLADAPTATGSATATPIRPTVDDITVATGARRRSRQLADPQPLRRANDPGAEVLTQRTPRGASRFNPLRIAVIAFAGFLVFGWTYAGRWASLRANAAPNIDPVVHQDLADAGRAEGSPADAGRAETIEVDAGLVQLAPADTAPLQPAPPDARPHASPSADAGRVIVAPPRPRAPPPPRSTPRPAPKNGLQDVF
jgi:serine/threonine protein kinase